MSEQQKDYRLDGIYRQRQEGFFMQRVKLAAGVISAEFRGAAAERRSTRRRAHDSMHAQARRFGGPRQRAWSDYRFRSAEL